MRKELDKNEANNKNNSLKIGTLAYGLFAGAMTMASIVIPTATILSQNADKMYVTIDYSVANMPNETITLPKQTTVSELECKPIEGYVFKGWYKDEECKSKYGEDEIIQENQDIFALYEKVDCAVIFPTSDAFQISRDRDVVDYGQNLSFTLDLNEGYKNSNVVVSVEDKQIYPDENNVYTIENVTKNSVVMVSGVELDTFDINVYIDGERIKLSGEYGTTIKDFLNANNLVANEYNSCGWFYDNNLLYPVDEDTIINKNINLYTKMATSGVIYGLLDTSSINQSIFTQLGIENLDLSSIGILDLSMAPSSVVLPKVYSFQEKDYLVVGVGCAQETGCQNIESVVLPSTCMVIGDYAFAYNGMLQNINLHSEIISIGESSFLSCVSLDVDFSLMNNLTSIGDMAFAGSGVKEFVSPRHCILSLGGSSFSNCQFLERVEVSKNVTLGYGVFSSCPFLEYIYLDTNIFGSYNSDFNYGIGDLIIGDSCSEKGATIIIGKSVTFFSYVGLYETGYSYTTMPAPRINMLIFEKDSPSLSVVSLGEGTLPSCTIIFDSQRFLNAYNRDTNLSQSLSVMSLGYEKPGIYVNESLDCSNIVNHTKGKSDKPGYYYFYKN